MRQCGLCSRPSEDEAAWITSYRRMLEARLDRLGAFLERTNGNKLVSERLEVERGGHSRFVEHAPEGVHGFDGRFREVTPAERLVQTFEWDGMRAALGHLLAADDGRPRG